MTDGGGQEAGETEKREVGPQVGRVASNPMGGGARVVTGEDYGIR